MRHPARFLALAALLGCSDLTEAEAGIVAIEITTPSTLVIAVGQSIQLAARALNQDGESVAAPIEWRTPDPTVSVGATTGVLTGVAVGTGRVQAVSGSLASALVTFTVDPAPAPAQEPLRQPR